MSVIKLDHVSYVYSKGTPFEKTAVDDVSLEIEKGEFVGVIGHTGSGKSTLMQHLNALLEPTSGKVYIDGEDVWADPKNVRRFRFKVGLVFQYPEYQLFEETIYKDVAFGPTNMGLSEAEDESLIRELSYSEAVCLENLGEYGAALEKLKAYREAYGADEALDHEIAFLTTRVPETEAAGGEASQETAQ